MIALLLFSSGLAVGSFLGALTYRLPRGKSVKRGRSVCTQCNYQISWYHNIPVISYLFLRGRCFHCSKKISLRYPAIELTCAFGFVGIWYLLERCTAGVASVTLACEWNDLLGGLALPYLLLILSILIGILVIDFEHQIIPDEFVFLGALATILALMYSHAAYVYLALVAGFASALFLLLIHLLTRGKGMGLGDVKLAIFVGLFFGWPQVVIWLFGAFIIGAIVGVVLIALRMAKFGKQIPFGPFLVISAALVFIWGNTLLLFFPFV